MKKSIVGIMVAIACFNVWSCDKDETMNSNKNEVVSVEVNAEDSRTPIEEYANGLRMVLEKYGNRGTSRSSVSDSMMVQEIRSLVTNYVNAYGKSTIESDLARPGLHTLSEDSIAILSQDMTAFQKWISKNYSSAFVSSYNAISNGTQYSSVAIENSLNNMTCGERLMIVTALEVDQYEISNGREIVSDEIECRTKYKFDKNLCLVLFANDAATSFVLSFTPMGDAGVIWSFVSYAMCIITAENNYQACLNAARGNH